MQAWKQQQVLPAQQGHAQGFLQIAMTQQRCTQHMQEGCRQAQELQDSRIRLMLAQGRV
jgi:hypothetical protein